MAGVDKRADIWAFGVVLYEMVTGHRPFEGHFDLGHDGRLLTSEPAWGQVPQPIEPLIRRCLVKDPRNDFATSETSSSCCRRRLQLHDCGNHGSPGSPPRC